MNLNYVSLIFSICYFILSGVHIGLALVFNAILPLGVASCMMILGLGMLLLYFLEKGETK